MAENNSSPSSLPLLRKIIRNELVIAGLALTIVLCIAFSDVVFGGKTLLSNAAGVMGTSGPYGYNRPLPDDNFRVDQGASAWQAEPLTRGVREAFLHARMPLWNPHAGAGTPLLADMQSAAFNPLRLPVLISPSPLMWDVYLLGRFLLGGLAAFLFARLLRLALPAGLAVAIGYVLSGHFFIYSNNVWLDSYFSLPLVLCGVELILRRPRALSAILLAGAVALNLLGGMPEVSFLTLLLAGAYAAYRLVFDDTAERRLPVLWGRMLPLGIGFSAGFGLAALLLLPFAEFAANSFTSHTAAEQVGLHHDPARFAASFLVPFINGKPLAAVSGGGWAGIRNYVGIALPLLAMLGLWHRPLALKAGWFFLAAGLLGLAKTYGVLGVNDLGRLPLANVTLFAIWSAPVIAFCAAVLAGIGIDRIYAGGPLGRSLHSSTLIVGATLLFLLYLDRDLVRNMPHDPGRWLLLGAAMGGGVWALLWAMDGTRARELAWGCLAVMTLELLLFTPHGNYRDRYDTFVEAPYVRFLQDATAKGERSRVFGFDALLFPNGATAYGLDDIRSLNALYPERYLKYVRKFISPGVTDRFVGGAFASGETLPRIDANPMFNLLGVEYVATRRTGLDATFASSLIDELVQNNGTSPTLNRSIFEIDGIEKAVLFAHAPKDVTFEQQITPEQSVLRFSAAIGSGAWGGPGDGVDFNVVVETAGLRPNIVWGRTVDPINVTADRHWLDQVVDLSDYTGRRVTIHLVTSPRGNTLNDWSGWGDLRLTGRSESTSSQFVPVYDGEVHVFRNQDVLPRVLVLHRVTEVADGEAALAAMSEKGFDPAQVATIEGKLPSDMLSALAAAPDKDGSSATVQSYEANRVVVQARLEHAGLVLLTDTNFPGWKAYVDGKRVDLYATDYLFRGVLVPAGQHEVTFKYDPASFKLGLALSLLTVCSLAGWLSFEFYRDRRANRTRVAEPD